MRKSTSTSLMALAIATALTVHAAPAAAQATGDTDTPQADAEQVFVVDIDPAEVAQARQSFDPCGHYSRPDVLSLKLNAARQQVLTRGE